MSLTAQLDAKKIQRVQKILIAQKEPSNKSPYEELEGKFGVTIDFVPFHHIEGFTEKEYRKQRVYPSDFTSIVFTGRTAIEHFFRLCEELRIKMPETTKYFCSSESTANYLQKFIAYRKRKVHFGTRDVTELKAAIVRNKKEKFFLPCSEGGNPIVANFFKSIGIPLQEAEMYRTVYTDLKELEDVKYDILAFFTSVEIKALFSNFPNFKQEDRRICAYGKAASKAIVENGMSVDIEAGTPSIPSIVVALENYLKISNPT